MRNLSLFALLLLGTLFVATDRAHAAVDCNVDSCWSGNISSNTTWATTSAEYVITDNLTVDFGVTLTVNPNVIIKFASGKFLVVNGGLLALGTSTAPIHFTSLNDDSVGGDTGGDGATSGVAGNWREIQINSGASSTLVHTNLRFGGGNGFLTSNSNFYNNGGTSTLMNVITSTSSMYGFRQGSGSASINNSEIAYNGDQGIFIQGGHFHIQSSEIHHNATQGIIIGAAIVNSYLNKYFNNSMGIYTGGAAGTIASKLDEIYSNSSHGVFIDNQLSTTTIDVAHIHNNSGSGVHIMGGNSISRVYASEINNNNYGVYVADQDGNEDMESNWFHDNINDGVYNNEFGGQVSAEFNFWNSSGGPNGSGGDGANILYVDYDPYLTALHSVFLIDSVDSSEDLYWEWTGITGSNRESDWHFAVAEWNALDLGSNVNIATSTGTTYLQVSTTTGADLGWAGLYTTGASPDTIQFNEYYMSSGDYDANDGAKRKNVMMHELGHALGLNHSSSTQNLLYPFVQSITDVGPQDQADYYYLW